MVILGEGGEWMGRGINREGRRGQGEEGSWEAGGVKGRGRGGGIGGGGGQGKGTNGEGARAGVAMMVGGSGRPLAAYGGC